jgi:hypothetical protein
LKRYLGERLPQYMIPARFIPMDKFPLNHNGKVDRSVLAAWEEAPNSGTASSTPGTELEQRIAAVWTRLLGRGVGLDDNFFDAGGTSLLLLEASAELSKVLGRTLEWTELFEHPTVRAIAGRQGGMKQQHGGALAGAQDRARRQKEAFARQKLARGSRI